ncbi:MAG: thiamine pyrophosphate-dependent dehydrogenase E1 component subunit alpha [Chthoniobacteraceae bacterium]
MVQAVETVIPSESNLEQFKAAYRWMLLARISEEKLVSIYKAGGRIHGGVFIGKGQEAVSVATGLNLRKGDVFAPLIRDQAGRLAFGEDLADSFRTYLGSTLGPMRGRDGNVHRGRPKDGMLPMISHLGAMIPVVNGVLMAKRFKGERGYVGATSIGDGGTSTGAFHEAINQAAVEKLPLVVVVTNNQYAYSTPNDRQFACADLLDKAIGYGIAGHSVNGTDATATLQVIGGAIAEARAGKGPQLVVAQVLRLSGHGEHDDGNYVQQALKDSPLGRDCLLLAEETMIQKGWATASEIAQLRADTASQVDEVANRVMREPTPTPDGELWRALSSAHLEEGYYSE